LLGEFAVVSCSKIIIMKSLFVSFALLILSTNSLLAQHGHKQATAEGNPLSFVSVLQQQLSDPELQAYSMTSSVMTIVPGGVDTVAHRHDCELFGYVLEGAINIGLEYNEPKTYKAGEMFYEKRNIIHSVTRNSSQDQPARVLLIFIIKKGRAGYTRLHAPGH
jgi:quercetin dioxygenase-like cupin family protein